MIELAIVAAVVGALVAIAVPVYRGYRERVAVKSATSDILRMQLAIDRDISEYDRVPNSIAHLPVANTLDPWGNPYQYLNVSDSAPAENNGLRRKDKNLVPINTDYDLYSNGPDGMSKPALTAKDSHDDIVRANDGAFIGVAAEY